MNDVQQATASLLDDRPDLRSALVEVLNVDANTETWTFEDVPVDSGAFGELVSRDLVEDTNGGYRVRDPEAIRRFLDGNVDGEDATGSEAPASVFDAVTATDPRVYVFAVVACLFVGLVRLLPVSSVFTNGVTVLLGNDPYLYRYWVERMTAAGSGPFDAAFGTSMGSMSAGEPLLVATLSWFTALLGGPSAAGIVLAVYPVVTAVITAGLLYLAVRVFSSDDRVALAAVVIFALLPEHALRTSLGFADHHAFDLVWLLTTFLGILLADDAALEDRPKRIVAAALVGFGVIGQTLAWEAGPLLFAPIGLYVIVRSSFAVANDFSPLRVLAPVVTGTAVGGVGVALAHVTLGWHSVPVASTPVLLFVGTLAVMLLAEVSLRISRSPRDVVLIGAVAASVLLGVAFVIVPELITAFTTRADFLFRATGIAESKSIFGPSFGVVFGPVLALGVTFYLSIPYLAWVWARLRSQTDSEWLAPAVYCSWFLILATIQFRFASELAPFVAVFAGVGFVHLATVVDLLDTPPSMLADTTPKNIKITTLPSQETVRSLFLLFVLVAGFGAIQTPLQVSKVTYDDGAVNAATWSGEYADAEGVEYPENYVFSDWGTNRFYNYFANGESETYTYAQRNYEAFLASTSPDRWYERLGEDDRRGFVVTETAQSPSGSTRSTYTRLHKHWGSRSGPVSGVAHYRAVYASDDGSVKLFEVVPGATITAPASPGETYATETQLSIAGHDVEYERTATGYPAGIVELTVPYPGTYEIAGQMFAVEENAVNTGASINGFDGAGAAWQLENGSGTTAFDIRGGHHARLTGGTWETSGETTNVNLSATDRLVTENATLGVDDSGEMTVSVRFRTNQSRDYVSDLKYPRLAVHGNVTAFQDTDGYQVAMSKGRLTAVVGDGDSFIILKGPRVDDGEWHNVSLVWFGDEISLILNGKTVSTGLWEGTLDVDGNQFAAGVGFSGNLDHVTVSANATKDVMAAQDDERADDVPARVNLNNYF